MVGRGQQQAPAGGQHAAHLREPPGDVDDVLDHLAGPHDVEGAVVEHERPVQRALAELERGMARAGAAQRLGDDVDAQRVRAVRVQRRAELARAAAEVEHALARSHARQQPVASHREPVRRGLSGTASHSASRSSAWLTPADPTDGLSLRSP